ncbi:MAG: CBS domain-containing protein [Clostridiales bacterium]|nr:CBS domain-containing protein [Clostridiales bacterium]
MGDFHTDEFLDLYRRLENAAEAVVGSGRGSSVFRLEKHRDFADYSEQIACFREVRNFLSHEPKFGGEYAIHPNERVVESLRALLELVENPPRVRLHMTPLSRLITASRETPVLPLMEKMQQNHISHVPILERGRVDSVFSVGTVFQAAIDGYCVNKDTLMQDLAQYLPLDRHMGQDFRFAAPDMLLREARAVFDQAYSRSRKLKLLLITDNALPDSSLLGVLSPYDVLGSNGK